MNFRAKVLLLIITGILLFGFVGPGLVSASNNTAVIFGLILLAVYCYYWYTAIKRYLDDKKTQDAIGSDKVKILVEILGARRVQVLRENGWLSSIED